MDFYTENIERFIKQLSHKDLEKRQQAAWALVLLRAKSAVPHLIKALDDSDMSVRQGAAEALGDTGDKAAVPHLIKALSDSKVCAAAARSLDKLGIRETAKLELSLSTKPRYRIGEFIQSQIELVNHGSGPAFNLRLDRYGQATGGNIKAEPIESLQPEQKVSRTVSIQPEAAGTGVPLMWKLTYDDIKGPEQVITGTFYLTVESPSAQPSVAIGNIGTLVHGPVDGPVIGKVTSQVAKPFSICPYCGQELKLPKTPRFCPYCEERLVSEG